jgi:hypothetical protein
VLQWILIIIKRNFFFFLKKKECRTASESQGKNIAGSKPKYDNKSVGESELIAIIFW